MYLRAAKTELEDAGESTEGIAESVSKLRADLLALTHNKVDIQIDEGTFKSTYQILKELSAVWKELSDVSQANILQMIGGKRNANVVAAILENFTIAENALETSAKSAGSALKENEKYLDSIQGRISIFKAQFEEFSSTVFKSRMVKGVIDIGTALISVLNTLQKIHALLPLMLAAMALIRGLKGLKSFNRLASRIASDYHNQAAEANRLQLAVAGLTARERALLKVQLQKIAVSKGMTAEQTEAMFATYGLAAAEGTATAATQSLNLSIKALFLSNPIGWVITAISAVIQGIMLIIDAVSRSKQAAIEAAHEIADAYKNAQDTYTSNIKTLKEMKGEFYKLSQGVNRDGENVSLTADEYERFLGLIDQIVGISPDICKGYDDQGRAILDYKGALDYAIASQEDFNKLQRDAYIGGGEKLFEGKVKEYEDVTAELQELGLEFSTALGKLKTDLNMSDAIYSLGIRPEIIGDRGATVGGKFFGKSTLGHYTPEVLKQIYENSNKILNLYKQAGTVDSELVSLETHILAFAKPYAELQEITEQIADNLIVRFADEDWYNAIPLGALDEFKDGLAGVIDMEKGFNENVAKAENFGLKFKEGLTDSGAGLLEMSKGLKDGTTSVEEYNQAVKEFGENWEGTDAAKAALLAFFYSLTNDAPKATGEVVTLADHINNLKESIEALPAALDKTKTMYDLLAKAQKEMADGGGLSPETIEALAKAEEGYIDCLYVENGVVKLNTEEWKKLAKAKMVSAIADVQAEITKLRQEKQILEALRVAYEEGIDVRDTPLEPLYTDELQRVDGDISAIDASLEAGSHELEIWQALLNGIETSSGEIADSAANAATDIVPFIDAIRDVHDGLTSLAELSHSGFKLPIDEALKYAEIYPAIFESAKLAADGQIQLDSDVANAFIDAKEAEYKAEIKSNIVKLEAERDYLLAQLEIIRAGAKATTVAEKIKARAKIKFSKVAFDALMGCGVSELEAYGIVAGAISGGSSDAVIRTLRNMGATEDAINGVIDAAHDAALAVSGIGSGEVRGLPHHGNRPIIIDEGGSEEIFDPNAYDWPDPNLDELDSYFDEIEEEILSAVEDINGQIALWEAILNGSLDELFNGLSGGSHGAKSNWFEAQYKLHQHLLAMDAESVEAYLAWLEAAYQKAYDEGIISLEDYWRYQEELLSKSRDLFKDYLNDIEHEISMREHFGDDIHEIKALYEEMIAAIEEEIAKARERGLDDNDEYIQWLQSQWMNYHDALDKMREDAQQSAQNAVDNLINIRIKMLKQDIQNEKDALRDKLDALRDFYDEQRRMLQDQRDEEKYLDEQAEKRKRVADIQAELAQLQFDDSAWAQKRKLELMQELADAQAELDEFEKDHALQVAQDELDALEQAQEDAINSQLDNLEEQENNAQALYEQALEDIKNGSIELYEEMVEWNNLYGDGIEATITDAWEEAYIALQKYYDLFGELYNGINLGNATGYTPPGESYEESPIAPPENTAPGAPHDETPTPPPANDQPEPTPPSLEKGSYVEVKPGTKWYEDSYGGGSWGHAHAGKIAYINLKGTHPYAIAGGGWIRKQDIVGYRRGTKHATAGWHKLDEEGVETLFTSKDGNKYRMFTGGEKVLNAKASNFLYKFANTGGSDIRKAIRKIIQDELSGKYEEYPNADGANIRRILRNLLRKELSKELDAFTGSDARKLSKVIRKAVGSGLTDELFKFARKDGRNIGEIIDKILGGGILANVFAPVNNYSRLPNLVDRLADDRGIMHIQPITPPAPPMVTMGDINIGGNADMQTVSEIRRAQREQLSGLLRELNKLNK